MHRFNRITVTLDKPREPVTDAAAFVRFREARVQAESRLMDLLRPHKLRMTDEVQGAVFPGDRGFQYVATLQDRARRAD